VRYRRGDDQGEIHTGEIRAKLVVDASGRGAMLGTHNDAKRRIDGLDASAIYAHFRGPALGSGDERGDIVIAMGERGWAWIIPFRDDHASIGVVVDKAWMAKRGDATLEAFFEQSLSAWPHAAALFESFEREGPVRTAANFSYEVSQIAGDGWLAVGDALGFIDPLFSSGAHMALGSGAAAAEAIEAALVADDVSASRFAGYTAAMRAASDMFLGVVRATYHGEFREMLFAADQRKTLRQVITSLLSGDVFHPEPAPTWVRFTRQRYPAR
jgi:flavin-dependent dehydrogenase